MRFNRTRRGASLLDYGLIAVVIIIASIGAISAVGGLAINPFDEAGSALGEGEEVAAAPPTEEPTADPTATPTPSPTPAPPDTVFTFSPASPMVGAPITFTGPTTGVNSWAWNFGGGATSTVQNPTHTYSTAGAKTVSLTVTGPGGTANSSQSISVAAPLAYNQTVLNMGPAAYWRLGDSAPVTAATYNTPGANLLLNSSFETAADWGIGGNPAIAKLVTAPAYAGTRTAMFDEATGWHWFGQGLTLAQGTYAVTGWVKAQNFVPGTAPGRFRYETAASTLVNGTVTFPSGTYDWQLLSSTIQVISSSRSGNFIISNNYGGSGGSGDLWVDQVMVRPLRAADSIGANHGTIIGAPTLAAAGLLTGDSNKAIAFNGSTQYITVPDAATWDLFSGTQPWTIAVWVNHTPDAAYRGIVEINPHIAFRSQGVDLLLVRHDGVASDALYSNPLTPGRHFVVARFNGVAIELFVDGAVNPHRYGTTGASTRSAPLPTGLLYIGANHVGGSQINGTVDEPAIFSRALTDAEISSLYVSGTYAP